MFFINDKDPIFLNTDASNIGIGAFLYQEIQARKDNNANDSGLIQSFIGRFLGFGGVVEDEEKVSSTTRITTSSLEKQLPTTAIDRVKLLMKERAKRQRQDAKRRTCIVHLPMTLQVALGLSDKERLCDQLKHKISMEEISKISLPSVPGALTNTFLIATPK